MKKNIFLLSGLIFLTGIYSCYMYKEDRLLKKTTKDWRDSPIIFSAYGDSPISSTFLRLRANKKFEYTSEGMLKTFHAGTWTNNQDTISLFFVDQNQKVISEKKTYIDHKKNRLVFATDTLVYMELRIMTNAL